MICPRPLEPVLNATPFSPQRAIVRQHSEGLGRDSEAQPLPDHAQLGLMQGRAEAGFALGGIETAADFSITVEVGAKIAAFGVPGAMGMPLNDGVGLLAGHAGFDKG